MQNKFFGSKLNTVLLAILIILMIIAIKIMLRNEQTYFPKLVQNVPNAQTNDEISLKQLTETKNIDPNIDLAQQHVLDYPAYMSGEYAWAFSEENDGIPKGWKRWNDTFMGTSVEKFSTWEPHSNYSPSYIIHLNADWLNSHADLMQSVTDKFDCVYIGQDGEEAASDQSKRVFCVVGHDPTVLRFWSVVNYFQY